MTVGEVVLDGGRAGEVQRERGLADGRAGGDDDHLAGMQAVGEFVELVEAGGDAHHALAAVAGGLDLVHGGFHDVLEDHIVLGGPAFGDGVDLGLGLVDQVFDLAVLSVAELDDLGAGVDQAAQHRAFAHDFGVVTGVGGRGDGLDEFVQVGGSADPVDFAALGQLVRDGDGVRGLAAAVEVDDGLVDGLVRRTVEVLAAQDLDDVGDGVLGQHHAAQD